MGDRQACVAIWLFAVAAICGRAEVAAVQITGTALPPYTVVLTYDDGFDELPADQTSGVTAYLARVGIPADFFIVGCHFRPQGAYRVLPTSSQCIGTGDRPLELLSNLRSLGFRAYNHSYSHVKFSTLTPDEIASDLQANQDLIDPVQTDWGLHLLRCPGLDCGEREARIINSKSRLAQLQGPINADVGGWFVLDDGSIAGGDWWFFTKGYSPEEAGRYYIRDIVNRSRDHGVIVLLHSRSEAMDGRDASPRGQFAVRLLKYVIEHLPHDYRFASLSSLPGFHENLRVATPAQWTAEFGSNDGYGEPKFGDIDGDGLADVCKARDGGIWCLWSDGTRFLPSTPAPQIEIAGAEWGNRYGHRFWLADLNGDGKADLVYPTSKGLMLSLSRGSTYGAPIVLASYFSAVDPGQLDSIAFGNVSGHLDGLKDLVFWTPSGVNLFVNEGVFTDDLVFHPPVVASTLFSGTEGWGYQRSRPEKESTRGPRLSPSGQYVLAIHVADINGDGLDDLCIRGSHDVYCALSDGKKFGKPSSWSKWFNNRQGFDESGQYSTFRLARIAGRMGFAGGTSCCILWQQAGDQLVRYLDAQNYSVLADWRQERYASHLAFASVTGDLKNEAAVLTRATGLYVGAVIVH